MFHSTLTVHSSGRRLCSHSDPASPQIHHNQLIWATITTHWFRECKYLATRWHVPIHGSRDMTAEFFIIWRFSGFGLSIGTTVLPIWLVVRVPIWEQGPKIIGLVGRLMGSLQRDSHILNMLLSVNHWLPCFEPRLSILLNFVKVRRQRWISCYSWEWSGK